MEMIMSDYLEEEDVEAENPDNFNDEDFYFERQVEEAQKEMEKLKDKNIIVLSEIDILKFKNFNLQIMLADKNVENLQLKQTVMYYEKKDVVQELSNLKRNIEGVQEIKFEDYTLDLPNGRIVHNSLLKKN
jgi:hypothetical protein